MDKIDEWIQRATGQNASSSAGSTGQNHARGSSPSAKSGKPVARQQTGQNQASQQKRGFFGKKFSRENHRRRSGTAQNQPQSALGQMKHPSRGSGKEQFPVQSSSAREQSHSQESGMKQGSYQSIPRSKRQFKNKPKAQRNNQQSTQRFRRPNPKSQHRAHPQTTLKPTPILRGKLKMIPLGGLNEVGKNMMALEYEDDIIILDIGLEFPSEDLLGIDYVVPDVSYLEANKKRIRGVLITHGHLDHIGGIPYILPKLDFPPVFATKLTIGLIQKRAEEFKQDKLAKYHVVNPAQPIRLGKFLCHFVPVTHSIPDSTALVIDTPIGKIMDTGDFKFDATPALVHNEADIKRLEALGHENVLALFCESTNALKPGHSMSEKDVGEAITQIIAQAKDRVIIASFSSQIGRLQQIIDAARKNNRTIFVSGRSMITNIEIAAKLGYLDVRRDEVKDIKQIKKYPIPDEKIVIITTGSQGESVSALARMANMEHANIKVKKGDTIVLSSSPIVGNEKAITTIINQLTMLGADIIHNELMDVHASGHGKQDELARMINYIKPKYLVPIHGEFYMRKGLERLAKERCNIPEERIIMLQNGDVLLAERDKVYISSEKIETKYILIDGSGEGKMGSQVQVDREILSQNGALVVLVHINKKTKNIMHTPDVVTRGFIYMHETEEITQEISKIAADSYKRIMDKNPGAERRDIKRYIEQSIDSYTHKRLERRPLIIPLIIEH